MKTGILLISALLGSSGALFAQNYLAYTKTHSNILDSTHAPIKHIEQGDAVYVLSEKPEHGMYRVIHLKSKKQGFIKKHDVKIHREIADHEKTTIATKASSVKDPVIEIHNSSRDTLHIKFDDVEFTVNPHDKHQLKVEKGSYYYKVYAHGIEPHYEYARVQDYKKYEWDFYVDEEPIDHNLSINGLHHHKHE